MKHTRTWLCGATWGSDDLYDQFIREDKWVLGWTNDPPPDGRPTQFNRARQIQIGDGIVLKRLCGQGEQTMRILARGTVMDDPVVKDDRVCCRVFWEDKGLDKLVHSHGCFSAIHRLFVYGIDPNDDRWLNAVWA